MEIEEVGKIRDCVMTAIEEFGQILSRLNKLEENPEPLITPEELASLLRCTAKHVYDQARDRKYPSYKDGANLRFRYSEVLKALKR